MSSASLRRPRRARAVLTAAIAVATALTLSACAPSANTGSDAASPAGDDAAFPVTITHALGETTIDERPERVVTVGWYSQDVAAALGVVPVGVEDFSWGDVDTYLPWFEEKVEDLGGELPEIIQFTDAGEYDYEQILALRPDVILAAHSGITEVMYERLTEIAPTVAYDATVWASERDQLTHTIATALGQADKADALLKAADDAVVAAAQKHPEFEGVTFSYGWFLAEGATSFDLYLPRDPRMQLTEQLGFTISPQIVAAQSTTEDFTFPVSLENLADIESDFHIGWINSADDLERTVENPLVASWNPIATGSDYFFDSAADGRLSWATTAPSVLSIPATIDDIADALSSGLKTN